MPNQRALTAPVAVGPAASAWPLHLNAATRAWEALALGQQPPGALMQAAGLATARLALALAPHAPRFQVYAGPGNNGGDGWCAATALHRLGRPVHVVDASGGRALPTDAAQARQTALAAGVPSSAPGCSAAQYPASSLLIDALLGLGAQLRSEGPVHSAVTDLRNAADQGHQVLAVDLPSGLHPDSGQPCGGLAVRAHHTLSLLTLKPGLFTGQGRDHAGQVWLHTLGTHDPGQPSGQLSAHPGTPHRWHSQHKGSFGDVAMLGGAPGMAGALVLAARAALCGGAGRVFAWSLDPAGPALDPAWPELMWRQATPDRWPDSATVVAGCGGGLAVAQHLPALLAGPARLVLDADALNAIAGDPGLQAALARRTSPSVLTPHPLEAARLLGSDTAAVQAHRLEAALTLAGRYRAIVLLKGSGTVLARPDGRWRINPTGNALLASAGTGDVLAGLLGGWWSAHAAGPGQALDAALHADHDAAFEAACAAAWWHGAAADQAWAAGQRQGLRAGALVEALAQTMRAPSTAG